MMELLAQVAGTTFAITFAIYFVGTWAVGKTILKEEDNTERSLRAAAVWAAIAAIIATITSQLFITAIVEGRSLAAVQQAMGILFVSGMVTIFGYIPVAKYVYGTSWGKALLLWLGVIATGMLVQMILAPLVFFQLQQSLVQNITREVARRPGIVPMGPGPRP